MSVTANTKFVGLNTTSVDGLVNGLTIRCGYLYVMLQTSYIVYNALSLAPIRRVNVSGLVFPNGATGIGSSAGCQYLFITAWATIYRVDLENGEAITNFSLPCSTWGEPTVSDSCIVTVGCITSSIVQFTANGSNVQLLYLSPSIGQFILSDVSGVWLVDSNSGLFISANTTYSGYNVDLAVTSHGYILAPRLAGTVITLLNSDLTYNHDFNAGFRQDHIALGEHIGLVYVAYLWEGVTGFALTN